MRVAMIGPFGLSPKGTMAMRALPLARALVRRGHAVAVLMPAWHTPDEAGRAWGDEGVALEYVPLRPWRPPLLYATATWQLVRRALAWRPDVIHLFKPKAYAGTSAWALWHRRRLGGAAASLVVDEDDWEGPGGWNDLEPYPGWMRRAFAWQERWGLTHNDAVTVASRALETLVWSLGVPPERVTYLPNGVTAGTPGEGLSVRRACGLWSAPVMLLYTRFFEFDVARVVSVLSRVRERVPQVRLLVVGSALYPRDGERFHRLIAEAGLGEAVVDAGWVTQAALADHLAAADVAIYPYDDTLINRTKCAVKLLDLLNAGVPVVADAVGQNCEYIRHGETGWLVPCGDEGAMVDAVCGLLTDRARARRIGAAARSETVGLYAWDVLAERLLAAYESARRRDAAAKEEA